MIRPVVHVALHLVAPAIVARVGWPERFVRAYLLMMTALLIDVDHLLATPVYAADRCSIGTHPLHDGWAMLLYAALVVPKKTRLVGVGLVLHVTLDAIDCLLM